MGNMIKDMKNVIKVSKINYKKGTITYINNISIQTSIFGKIKILFFIKNN